MALVDNVWYIDFGDGSTTGYYSVAKWAASTTYVTGNLVRQLATPTVGNERVFVCIASTSGTGQSGGSEPTWTVTRGAKNTDNNVTWQEATGVGALNGDMSTNTPNWTTVKGTAITLGQVIQSGDGTKVLICTTAGTAGSGSEPSWSAFTNAGATTADNTATWTTIGTNSTFGKWAAPHALLENAYTGNWGQAGNTFYVASEHNSTRSSAINYNAPGTVASRNLVICVGKTNVPPGFSDVTTGATISTTGASTIQLNAGYVDYWGIAFSAGSSNNNASLGIVSGVDNTLTNCSLKLNTTSASPSIVIGTSGTNNSCRTTLINTPMIFGNAAQTLNWRNSNFFWKNTASALQGTLPSILLVALSNFGYASWEGLDLSNFSGTISPTNMGGVGLMVMKDCKLNSGVTVSGQPNSPGNMSLDIVRCDSGGTNYRTERYRYQGNLTTSTSIVRTNGASDGITPISYQVITTANAFWISPFESFPIIVYNGNTSVNVNVTVEGVVNGASVPLNSECWFDVEYLGSSSSPLGSFASGTRTNPLASGSALTATTSAWDSKASARTNNNAYVLGNIVSVPDNPGRIFFCTTAGTSANSEPAGYATAIDGGSVTDGTAVFRAGCRFKQTVTLSSPQPGQTGYIYVYPKMAKASTTYFIDPLITLS